MLTCGIDMGSRTIKVVLLKDKKLVDKVIGLAGIDAKGKTQELLDGILQANHLGRKDVHKVFATGAGRAEAPGADGQITEVGAAAFGAALIHPETRTIIDIGAEEGRAIRSDAEGKVIDFAVNEKCAAGTGAFIEAMARALEVTVETFGLLSLKSTQAIPMNAQCAVFAESEVVSMMHQNVPKPDMARAVHDAIASRLVSLVRKVGFEKDVVLIGGVARNLGFVDSMRRELESDIFVLPDPDFVGAVGAAVAATH